METVHSSDGTNIAFERSGSGPPLLLVHGSAVDHRAWASVAPLLARRFTVYALDRRGRGASGDSAQYAVEREVDDITSVLDLIAEPAALLGHSSGAILVVEAALRGLPLRGLVLYEPPLIVDQQRPSQRADLAQRLQALVAAGEREAALRTFLSEGPGLSEAELDRMVRSPRWAEQVALAHTTPYDAQVAGGYTPDPRRLRILQQPIVLLIGGNSPGWMRAGTEALAAALPHGRIVVLPGQKHSAHYTAPELVAREVAAFLDP